MIRAFAILTLALVAATAAYAQSPQPTVDRAALARQAANSFDEGIRLMETDQPRAEQALREAIATYESLLKEGVDNGAIHYNLGNAYALLGDVGHAMLAYRRAAMFIPNDPNLLKNIETLESQLRTEINAAPAQATWSLGRSWLRSAPPAIVAGIALVSWSVFWLALTIRQRWRSMPRAFVVIAAMAFLCSAAVAAGAAWAERTDERAIITAPETVGRKGPDATAYAPSFAAPLTAGMEVTLVDTRPGWSLVRLADTRETWVPSTDLERIQKIK